MHAGMQEWTKDGEYESFTSYPECIGMDFGFDNYAQEFQWRNGMGSSEVGLHHASPDYLTTGWNHTPLGPPWADGVQYYEKR
jgi:hypothetical protein